VDVLAGRERPAERRRGKADVPDLAVLAVPLHADETPEELAVLVPDGLVGADEVSRALDVDRARRLAGDERHRVRRGREEDTERADRDRDEEHDRPQDAADDVADHGAPAQRAVERRPAAALPCSLPPT